jgi:branched-chain amino acid transport system ATP-binding protein
VPILFEVKGLSKRFGHIAALSDVSFRVESGEILGLIGSNGAGKIGLWSKTGSSYFKDYVVSPQP